MTEKLLSELTTAQVGGPAKTYVRATSEAEIIEAVSAADAAGEPVLIVGGGSNLLVSDEGFNGTVVHIASEGVEVLPIPACGGANVRVQAGTIWDDFVKLSIENEWVGPAALSGIPGTVGATPVQNVGAYGVEVGEFIASVRTWDREKNAQKTFASADLRFGYRDSVLKRATVNGSPRYVVLTVDFQFTLGSLSSPIRYAELAKSLGVEPGQRAESALVREKVLELRGSKGMVLNPEDRDTFSTGSFFTNPIVPRSTLDSLPEGAPNFPVVVKTSPFTAGVEDPDHVKLSAAWLIQHAGFEKGFGLEGESREIAQGCASLSTKHTLAITNRGGASAEDIFAIARAVRDGVRERFGVTLVPEPVVVNGEI